MLKVLYLVVSLGILIVLYYTRYLDLFIVIVFALIYLIWTIFSSLFFASALRLSKKKVYMSPSNMRLEKYPSISIFLPLYQERKDSIEKTVKSILNQNYPRDKLEVLFILEPDDRGTEVVVEEFIKLLRDRDIVAKKVFTDGALRIKARALNFGLGEARGELIGIFDSDDYFPEDYFLKVAGLFQEEGFGAVGTRVYRDRDSVLGKILNVDMYLWYNVYLPVIAVISNTPLLSGEGFFVRKGVVEAIGGFPERLAEDAFTTIKVKEVGYDVGLVDSFVLETAPRDLKAFVKQRLRWYRGYLECLGGIIKSRIPRRAKFMLMLSMSTPAVMSLGFLLLLISIVYPLLGFIFRGFEIKWIETLLSNRILLGWGLLIDLLTLGVYGVLFMKLYMDRGWRGYAKYIALFPFYWLFLSAIALYAPFVNPRVWYKTER